MGDQGVVNSSADVLNRKSEIPSGPVALLTFICSGSGGLQRFKVQSDSQRSSLCFSQKRLIIHNIPEAICKCNVLYMF